jgi:radical SAM superfamily enzyme YgiQ (UPF0313 family)
MELPFRSKGDELLPPGAMRNLRARLRPLVAQRDLTAVVAYAFDSTTRMLPFVFVDKRMAPGGPRAIGAALLDIGIARTRVVLQQWNGRFDPAQMRLDDHIPDLFCVSSMGLHGRAADRLIRRANEIDEARRPLILAGGPRTNYEPWRVFGTDPDDPWGADVACTGEAYVFLSLLEVLLEAQRKGESLRAVFLRCRDAGALAHIPGLVYAKGSREGVAKELIDTGTQRLLQDLDELPHPVLGFACLEPPSRRKTLAPAPLPPDRVKRHSPIASIEMTYGCKFRCPYCPIPAYNQHQDRQKSPARIADEFKRLHETYGITWFFGTDDNFLNRHERALAIVRAIAGTRLEDGSPLAKKIRWGTEATVHDAFALREHLPLMRRGGLRALWLGVEDMTATLVKKGQSLDKTRAVFEGLRQARIFPMPMMMHDDGQPLFSLRSARGLLNQAQILRTAGAMSFQVLYLTPAHGSKLFKETFDSGLAYERVGNHQVDESMYGGNYVVASRRKRPWLRQMNAVLAYLWFYNPLRFLKAIVAPTNRKGRGYDLFFQAFGMFGLFWNLRRLPWWMGKLLTGRIVRATEPPHARIPMHAVDGGLAAHDLPSGPDPKTVRRLETRPLAAVRP